MSSAEIDFFLEVGGRSVYGMAHGFARGKNVYVPHGICGVDRFHGRFSHVQALSILFPPRESAGVA